MVLIPFYSGTVHFKHLFCLNASAKMGKMESRIIYFSQCVTF